jgi:hypothetical protein
VQQPTKFSASVVCSGTIGRSTLSVLAAGPDRGYGNADATVVLILLPGARLQSRLVLCPLFGDAPQVKYVALEPLGATEGASHDVAYHSRQAEAGNVGHKDPAAAETFLLGRLRHNRCEVRFAEEFDQ